MATTIEAEYEKKDILSPTTGKYYIVIKWILDPKTLVPVNIAPIEYSTAP